MDAVQARMRAACALSELAIALRRQALTRQHPTESRDQIAARLEKWLMRRDAPRRISLGAAK